MNKKKELSAIMLGIAVAVILWLTILGREAQADGISFYKPFHSLRYLWRDIQHGGVRGNVLGNLLLFIPVGTLIPLVTGWEKMWRTAVLGLCFSLLIEVVQLVSKRGVFDPDDVLLNCMSCIIGYGLLKLVTRLFAKILT